jgi:tetratricopeptide (TPR) repeat protein
MVDEGAASVSGRLDAQVIQGVVRNSLGRFRACYQSGLRANPLLQGRIVVRFTIDKTGAVASAGNAGSTMPDQGVVMCVVRGFTTLSFPPPDGGSVNVTYPLVFGGDGANGSGAGEMPQSADPYTGKFKTVMGALARGSTQEALSIATAWQREEPGDVMALVGLGEALEKDNQTERAARAYGSIIDLFASRADLRRFAGNRLERLRGDAGLDLAVDTYEKAEKQRPDHPSSHRMLGYARLRRGDYQKAFETLALGASRGYPPDRFRGVDRILREDLGLIAAAWMRAEPARAGEILRRLRQAGGTIEDRPSMRFILSWETDANDVDFHIFDAKAGHAFFSSPHLASGGDLYADVTTGYGPECFTIRGPRKGAPYTLQAHYYSRGPMGYGMGKLEIIDHDGAGNLKFEERPYVVMVDHGFVDLGTVAK